MAHMRKHHQDSTKIQSPLGSFPSSNSATVLQFDEADAATQGSSSGAVNSPKVVTTATYGCAVCEVNFQKKEEVTAHMDEEHVVTVSQQLQDDNEALDEAGEEHDLNYLYDHFEKISELLTMSEKDKDTTKDVVDKVDRFKAILKKKDTIYEATKVKLVELKVENKRLTDDNDANCGECRNITEVETFLHNSLDAKEAEVNDISKKLKKVENDLKKTKDQHKAALDTVHDTLGNVTQRNNDLKTELAKQKALVTALEETNAREGNPERLNSNQDDAETESDVAVHEPSNTERVTMSKKSTEHKCHACDRVFNAAGNLDQHINDKHDKHNQNECHMCNKKFTNRKQVEEHICTEGDIIEQKCEKSYCKKKFVNRKMLKTHMKNAHFGDQRTVCQKCGEIFDSNMNMKKHIEVCGKAHMAGVQTPEKSNEVCKHWRRGRCHWGNQCNFSHVGRQDVQTSEHQSTRSTSKICWNGPSCSHLARGKCNFEHHRDNEHQQRTRHQSRGQQSQWRRSGALNERSPRAQNERSPRAQCKWGGQCNRVPNCPHLHSLEDFPQYSNMQGFRGTTRGSNGRHSRS